jgi:phytoene dehydrogenase-like protein
MQSTYLRVPARKRRLGLARCASGQRSCERMTLSTCEDAPAIVVGAGHSGLVCAARLAAAGRRVLVLERSQRPGGAVGSEQATLPGFVHDSCAGFFPMTLASPAFAGLGVRERLEWVDPPVSMAHPFADGRAIVLARDLEQTAESLEAASRGAGVRWRSLMAPLLEHRDRVLALALAGGAPRLRDALALALALRGRALRAAALVPRSSAHAGQAIFAAGRPGAWLAGSTIHSDLDPLAPGGAALALGLHFLAHAVGWGYPRGGAGALARALAERVGELGGEVRCGQEVSAVRVRGERAVGVELADGGTLRARAVVLALSARAAVGLLPPGALPVRLQRRLRRWRYGLGAAKLDFALAGPVPWRAPAARRAAVVHVAGALEEMLAARRQALAGELPERPALVVGQHTLHDPSRAPAGKHTLYAYTHVPQGLAAGAEELAERVRARIEELAPGFGRLVLAGAVRLPAALERRNPSLVGGDLAGGSCALEQQLLLRPAPRLWRGRTPLAGLYLAGSSVHPGPGVHGASGAAAARALLSDG